MRALTKPRQARGAVRRRGPRACQAERRQLRLVPFEDALHRHARRRRRHRQHRRHLRGRSRRAGDWLVGLLAAWASIFLTRRVNL
eukprot:5596699-Pleurochrysis_carterae.AAC.4